MFSLFQSKEDKAFLASLESARNEGITSMRVVGRGTLTMDPTELAQSTSFKKMLDETSKLVKS